MHLGKIAALPTGVAIGTSLWRLLRTVAGCGWKSNFKQRQLHPTRPEDKRGPSLAHLGTLVKVFLPKWKYGIEMTSIGKEHNHTKNMIGEKWDEMQKGRKLMFGKNSPCSIGLGLWTWRAESFQFGTDDALIFSHLIAKPMPARFDWVSLLHNIFFGRATTRSPQWMWLSNGPEPK